MSTDYHYRTARYHRAPRLVLVALALLAVVSALTACDNNPPVEVASTVFAVVQSVPPDQAIDVVFVPDTGYGDLADATNLQNFYDDVVDLIDDGFYQNNAIFRNTGLFNFWYILTPGTVSPPPSGICPVITWPSLTDAAFAEMVVIVHRNSAIDRDCGGSGRASSRAGGGHEWVIVHEGGHAAFALPDEYCYEYCCDGGYWHAPPILYNSQSSCENDPANAAWRDCQSFTADDGNTWWRSEDMTVDLMSAAGPPVHEVGRADWILMRSVLTGLPGASVNDPLVFAPDTWNRP